MTISASDVKIRKSETVTDTGVNGGRKSFIEIVSGARHSFFPRVTKAERTNGVTRYRKLFWANEDADDETAFEVKVFLEYPSTGGDRFYIGKGTQNNDQSDITTIPPLWTGAGTLDVALVGAETAIDVLMENNDFEFGPLMKIHLADKVQTGQTIASDVGIGDSVEEITGTWQKIAATTDIVYPKGLYLGASKVLSELGGTNEEFLIAAENKTTDEDIGTGDGSTTNPVLTDLAAVTNGLVVQDEFKPVVTTVAGSVTRTVTINPDGSCSGYCDAGQITVATGVWTTDINWLTAPDNTEDILITYYDKNYSYSGNVVTIDLESGEQVANAYATANTIVSGCVEAASILTSFDNWVETSASGTYDEATYPPTLFNDGTVEDTWTITFTSATAFTVSGANEGSVGTGSISADFSPTNPNTGQPYFTILSAGWGGTWQSGDTVVFQTHPSAFPVWHKEVVPAATAAEADNLTVLGWYTE